MSQVRNGSFTEKRSAKACRAACSIGSVSVCQNLGWHWARRPRPIRDGAEHCTVTPRRPGARRRTSATRPKAPARSSSRTARRPRSTRGAASSKPLRLLLDGVWGVLEPSESRVHLHAIDATSARSRGIYNTRRPRDALIDVLRRPATATSWTSPTCRRSSATRRSSCTSSRSR